MRVVGAGENEALKTLHDMIDEERHSLVGGKATGEHVKRRQRLGKMAGITHEKPSMHRKKCVYKHGLDRIFEIRGHAIENLSRSWREFSLLLRSDP